ncbi:MAG: hypothetical protein E6772_12325 [Dysgonomonas sp.]|nr:hypothetical protein [Dysgonomonas sp.]
MLFDIYNLIKQNPTINMNKYFIMGVLILLLYSCNNNKVNDSQNTTEIVPSTNNKVNYVNSDKAYFYAEPKETSKNKTYLVKGDSINITQETNGFGYTIFINQKGQKTEGWLKLSDLSSYNSSVKINYEQNLDNIIGRWVYTFDTGDEMGMISYEFEVIDKQNAYYRPCYDDCVYVGTYKISRNTLNFEGEEGGDNIDPENISTIKVEFNINGSTLVSEKGEIYSKEEINKVPPKSKEIEPKPIENAPLLYAKTMEDAIPFLTKALFIGVNENEIYESYSFSFVEENINEGSATFKGEYSKFVINMNLGTTPMDILAQSANQVTYLRVDRGTFKLYSKDLANEWTPLKMIKGEYMIPRFYFRISRVDRNDRGNITYIEGKGKNNNIHLQLKPKR